VLVLLILAGVAILVGVVSVAIGRGGEMAEFAGDYPPIETDDLLTAADVAVLRPPSALWGYNTAVTDEALDLISKVVTERDVEIATLRRQLAELRATTGPAGQAASTTPVQADWAEPTWPEPEPAEPAPVDWAQPAGPAPGASMPAVPAEPELAEPEPAEPGPAVAAEAASADAESVDGETGSADAAPTEDGTGPDA
jgi:hypothetical protein